MLASYWSTAGEAPFSVLHAMNVTSSYERISIELMCAQIRATWCHSLVLIPQLYLLQHLTYHEQKEHSGFAECVIPVHNSTRIY